MTTTVRARDARDLLSALPYLVGFRPVESAVVACLRPDGTVGLVARVSLAEVRDPAEREQVAGLLATRAGEDGAPAALVVLYTAAPVTPGTAGRAVADALRAALLRRVPFVERWVVGESRYRALDCDDDRCCPPDGHPVAALESTAVSARLVLEGFGLAASREAVHALGRAGAAARGLAGRAAVRWQRAGDEARAERGRGADGPLREWRGASLDAWEACVRTAAEALARQARAPLAPAGSGERVPGPVELPPAPLGRLAAALADTAVRDAVLLWCVPGTGDLAVRTAGGGPAAELDAATAAALAAVVDPVVGRRPDPGRTAAAVAVLEAVVAHAPRHRTAAPLTLLGFLAWWSGDGGRAGDRVAAALAVDDGHRLAVLLSSALAAAVPPGWARRAVDPPGVTSG